MNGVIKCPDSGISIMSESGTHKCTVSPAILRIIEMA